MMIDVVINGEVIGSRKTYKAALGLAIDKSKVDDRITLREGETRLAELKAFSDRNSTGSGVGLYEWFGDEPGCPAYARKGNFRGGRYE